MCSTCNYKSYEPVFVPSGDKEEEKLQQSIGLGDLLIRCDPSGKNYWITVNGNPKSSFRIYRCPTCGGKLY